MSSPGSEEPEEWKPTATWDDLPPELRNRIYGYRLQKPNIVKLKTRRRQGRKAEVVRRGLQRKETWTGWETIKSPKRTALLLLNRKFGQEAAGILYSVNTFSFESTSTLNSFFEVIGDKIKLLSQLQIEPNGYMITSARKTGRLLSAATGLRSLVLPHHDVCPSGDGPASLGRPIKIADILEHFLPFIKALQPVFEKSDTHHSILDLVQIKPVANGDHGSHENCEAEDEMECIMMTRKDMRREVAKLAGVVDPEDVDKED